MGGARTCGDPGWERGGGSLGEWVGDFSLDFGGDEVDLLAVLVHHNRIASGPRVRAQNDPVLGRERVCWLSACPIPQETLLIPPVPRPRSLGTQGPRWWFRSCVDEGSGGPGGFVLRMHFWKRSGVAQVEVPLHILQLCPRLPYL